MKKTTLKRFRTLLLQKRKLLAGDIHHLEERVLSKSLQESSGDLSHFPLHFADVGSDMYEQEVTLSLVQNGEEAIWAIDEALEKIEDGSFGICELCERDINLERLKAIPHAKLCIECKREQESQRG